MEVKNIEGIKDYKIGYFESGYRNKHHYSCAELIYNGYEITLPRVYYSTMDEAVQGIKERLAKAVIDFKIPTTQQTD